MTHDELIEAVALALVNRDQERFDLPCIETVADFRCQEDAAEYLANARAAIRVIAPAVLDEAAIMMTPTNPKSDWTDYARNKARWADDIRALKTRYEV